jgi:hypothetical protein
MHSLGWLLTDAPTSLVLIWTQLITRQPAGAHTSFVVQKVLRCNLCLYLTWGVLHTAILLIACQLKGLVCKMVCVSGNYQVARVHLFLIAYMP